MEWKRGKRSSLNGYCHLCTWRNFSLQLAIIESQTLKCRAALASMGGRSQTLRSLWVFFVRLVWSQSCNFNFNWIETIFFFSVSALPLSIFPCALSFPQTLLLVSLCSAPHCNNLFSGSFCQHRQWNVAGLRNLLILLVCICVKISLFLSLSYSVSVSIFLSLSLSVSLFLLLFFSQRYSLYLLPIRKVGKCTCTAYNVLYLSIVNTIHRCTDIQTDKV